MAFSLTLRKGREKALASAVHVSVLHPEIRKQLHHIDLDHVKLLIFTTKRESYPPNHRCHSAKFSIFLTRNPNPNIKANCKKSKLM